MADKKICLACDSKSSDIHRAFVNNEDCPYCGFPATCTRQLEKAQKRDADAKLVIMAVQSEARALSAEREVAQLKGELNEFYRLARGRG